MKQQLSLLLLGLALSLTTSSCGSEHKAEDPQPAPPAPAYTLGRSFYFPSSFSMSVGYPAGLLRGDAYWAPEALHLNYQAEGGHDAIHFAIDRSRLPASLLGRYSFKSRMARGNDAAVRYTYTLNDSPAQTAFRIIEGDLQDVEGSLSITGYDAERQLLSGSYEVRLPDVLDPTEVTITPTTEHCSALIQGSFENLPLR